MIRKTALQINFKIPSNTSLQISFKKTNLERSKREEKKIDEREMISAEANLRRPLCTNLRGSGLSSYLGGVLGVW